MKRTEIFESIKFGITAAAIVFPITSTIFNYIVSINRVEGASMQPTLNPIDISSRDWVLLRKLVRPESIQRGDVVCIVSPRNPRELLIKRVLALEGDVVRSKKRPVRIPEGHCWLESDNHNSRAINLDSNIFGPVSLGLVEARATHIVWPPHRLQQLPCRPSSPPPPDDPPSNEEEELDLSLD